MSHTPITPLEPGVEMFQKGETHLFLAARTSTVRPFSEGSECYYTDFEDNDSDKSEFEEDFVEYNPDNRENRRSQATLSTFDEVPTPCSSRNEGFSIPFLENKPVQGPKGPHLFSSLQLPGDFNSDHVLQLSPLLPARVETAFQCPVDATESVPTSDYQSDESIDLDTKNVRNWSSRQVALWMNSLGYCDSIVNQFLINDISGLVLLDLQFEDLKELDIQSFGKRHKLWNEIETLRGNNGITSPTLTTFEDTSRPCTRTDAKNVARTRSRARTQHDDLGENDGVVGKSRRKRTRKGRHSHDDAVTPAESVSIVAIEQLLPKPHKCQKGERCAKWRRQQKLLAKLHDEHGFPVSPEKGGRIFVSGNPGNVQSATPVENVFRPTSATIPSVVASSDVLGSIDAPNFPLQEGMLQNLESRDPQENVKQFLTLQGLDAPTMVPYQNDSPREAPLDLFPPLLPSENVSSPHEKLKTLPRLEIPRSASANTCSQRGEVLRATSKLCPSVASPTNLQRFGTPASEMDVAVTAVPPDPLSRNTSQSVPPNMQFGVQLASSNHGVSESRFPPFGLPALNEDEVFQPISPSKSTTITKEHENSSTSVTGTTMATNNKSYDQDKRRRSISWKESKVKRFEHEKIHHLYPGAKHAGWMKKRKTSLLRHDWQKHHFRLMGTQLVMHADALPSSTAVDTIDVGDYAVACSSAASNKLTAKLKSLKIASSIPVSGAAVKSKGVGNTSDTAMAFNFQLIPMGGESIFENDKVGGGKRKAAQSHSKTHHFAVTTRDERIDWMRELMLAKALKAKNDGYEVKVNGNKI